MTGEEGSECDGVELGGVWACVSGREVKGCVSGEEWEMRGRRE